MINMRMNDSDKMDYHEDTMLRDKARYPYGLKITLEPEVLQKLGVSEPPKVGSKKMMLAEVECVSVSKEMNDDGKFSVTLQITDMDIKSKDERDSAEKSSIASKLYEG